MTSVVGATVEAPVEDRSAARAVNLTLRASLQDLADMTSGRADARVLLLHRRVRPRGDLRLLARLPKVFG